MTRRADPACPSLRRAARARRGRLTFGEYAERWLRSRTFDESTRETTEQRLRSHLLPYFGHRQLAAIKPAHVRGWDRTMVGKLAPGTRAGVFAHLRTILGAAVDDERIAKNPCAARSVTPPRPAERRVVPWKQVEVSAIRDELPERYRPMIDLGAGCGLRQGEIFGFSPQDIDFDGGWLHVVRQVKIVRSQLVFGLPKNDRDRRIPLPGTVAAALREHVDAWPAVSVTLPWEDPAGPERRTIRLSFYTARRNAFHRSTFNREIWKPAVEGAGITPTSATGMHALRHFYASALLDAGENVRALATYLGHSDPGFTLRVYTHLMPSSDDRTRRAIDNLFGAGQKAPDGPEAD